MCRGKTECSELGLDVTGWDRQCPLRQPAWMGAEIDQLVIAMTELANGNRTSAIEALEATRNEEMQDWFIEHAQISGRHRALRLARKKPTPIPDTERDQLRNPKKHQREVFERDRYRCRYCGIRLIDQAILKEFIARLNWEGFRKGSTNLTTHGLIHITWPVADHLIPWNLGGRTDPSNLVTSCGPCNYGKDGYTLEQLGLDEPPSVSRDRELWDGLTRFSHTFKA